MINDTQYWDQRFQNNWEGRGGREQTRGFANELLPFLLSLPHISSCKSLIDVGCALGDACVVYSDNLPYIKVSGCDISSIGVEKAQTLYPSIPFYVSGMPHKRYDIVVCSNVLEHIPDWRSIFLTHLHFAKKYYIAMFPHAQADAGIGEHYHRFTDSMFPLQISNFSRLFYHIYTSSHWAQQQAIVCYEYRKNVTK